MTAGVLNRDLIGATSTTREGQARWAFPALPRSPHPTGVQVPCASCARAGVDRLGLPREGEGSRPLCLPCWRAEEDRRRRAADEELLRLYWDQVGGVDLPDERPVMVAEVEAQACPVCESEEPTPTCWLCGYTWLEQARQAFATELELSEVEVSARFEAMAAVSTAEDRVTHLTQWISRLRGCVESYARRGSRGRPVELLADLMARDVAARTTLRGRPSALHEVAAVMAVDSDWCAGRRSLPGRARTAELAGCAERAVSSAWRRAEALGWATRTRDGGKATLAERIELGRSNHRSEWDLVQLHRSEVSTADRAEWVPVALGVLGDLLDHAQDLLDEAAAELETARARNGGWVDWPERVEAAQRRQAIARVVEEFCSPEAALALTANFCTPPGGCTGECFSSCLYWGLQYSRPIMIHSSGCGGDPAGGREMANGASRSPTRGRAPECDLESCGCDGGRCCGSPQITRPRTVQDAQRASHREPPAWIGWATDLARDLTALWPWLSRSPRRWVVATLGAALGPDWTAQAVVGLVRQRCGPLAPADQIQAPAAYLRELLRCALRDGAAAPHAARAEAEQRRAQVAAEAERLRARQDAARAEDEAQRAAAAAATGAGRAAAREAAMAAARAAAIRRDAAPTGRARIGGPRTTPAEVEWPPVAQPGSGRPAP
ncbi:MAG: hypothetical protein JXA67_06450 [Micromonosporaceae bacterium]|nr:hypothetical protein [Micromonosporaceae bacterium]